MTTKKKMFVTLLSIVTLTISFLGYYVYQLNSFFESMGECGMEAGPIYGEPVNISLTDLEIDTFISIPNGQLAIANTNVENNLRDTIPPIFIRLNNKKEIVWAISLKSNCGVPLYAMDYISLTNSEYGKSISFFNKTYGEPGTIYLKENYEFEYVCLSPM